MEIPHPSCPVIQQQNLYLLQDLWNNTPEMNLNLNFLRNQVPNCSDVDSDF